MRIAVSIWENKVSPVLDTATKLLIVDNKNQREARFEAYLLENNLSQRSAFIRGLDIQVLICGAVSRQLSERLKAAGMVVISGISGSVEDVLTAYLQGNLDQPRYLMPGCKFNTMDQPNKI